MVVFAVVLVTVVSQVVLITELAVLDPCFKALLFLGAGLAETTVDPLTSSVDRDAFGVTSRRMQW